MNSGGIIELVSNAGTSGNKDTNVVDAVVPDPRGYLGGQLDLSWLAMLLTGASGITALNATQIIVGANVQSPSLGQKVNIIEYAKAMHARTEIYQKDGKDYVRVTYNGITQSYTYFNSGNIDDTVLNAKFGWDSFLTDEDRAIGVGIYIYKNMLYKDFTVPINAALSATAAEGNRIAKTFGYDFVYQMIWFYGQVNHGADWDIKLPDNWNKTISAGTETFPGVGVRVYYDQWLMTPEQLGNFTYGYIGAAVRIPLIMLYGASWLAAGFPLSGNELYNEFYADHPMIERGFEAYKNR